MMKKRIFIFLLLTPIISFAQKVNLNKSFSSTEMTAVKMIDQTTLYSIDTINVKLGKYDLGEIACNIVLKDINGNGKFNDVGIDEIGLLDQYTDTIYHSYQSGLSYGKLNEAPAIMVDDILLEVESISDDGTEIVFKEVDGGTLVALAWTITYLPFLKMRKFSGEEVNLVDYLQDEKYIFFEFWGTWCEPCINLIPEIRKIEKLYRDKVKIVSLNYGDNFEDAAAFIVRNKLEWEHLIVERAVLEKFSVTTFPRGILFDKTGKLLDMDISISELEELLESK